uniref:Uncharacterized protein n=1 Tax=Romanomermis culicivorax TaxID=13658 RepID=A0A915HWS0_ROMCU
MANQIPASSGSGSNFRGNYRGAFRGNRGSNFKTIFEGCKVKSDGIRINHVGRLKALDMQACDKTIKITTKSQVGPLMELWFAFTVDDLGIISPTAQNFHKPDQASQIKNKLKTSTDIRQIQTITHSESSQSVGIGAQPGARLSDYPFAATHREQPHFLPTIEYCNFDEFLNQSPGSVSTMSAGVAGITWFILQKYLSKKACSCPGHFTRRTWFPKRSKESSVQFLTLERHHKVKGEADHTNETITSRNMIKKTQECDEIELDPFDQVIVQALRPIVNTSKKTKVDLPTVANNITACQD